MVLFGLSQLAAVKQGVKDRLVATLRRGLFG